MDLKVTDFAIDETGIAVVGFNRPGRGNSWTPQMNAEYRWIMAQLDQNPAARVIVVTGAGNQFCVGADFKALDLYAKTTEDYAQTLQRDDLAQPGHGVREAFDHDIVWQWGMKKPIIAAVNGACAGIAVAVAAFADFRYAASGAKITTASARIGLPAEYGLGWLLPRMVGITHAVDILLTGRIVLAEEALKMGLLHGVFPAEVFQERVLERARTMARTLSPMGVATTKRQLYSELMHLDVGGAVEDSKALIGALLRTPDYQEGAAAMMERRDPGFMPLDRNAAIPQSRR